MAAFAKSRRREQGVKNGGIGGRPLDVGSICAKPRAINRAATLRCHARVRPMTTRESATRRIARVSVRARARAALVLMAVSASFGLAGCAAIDELKEAFLRWVESEKLPSGRGSLADDLPDATPVTAPEKPSKKEASKPSKKQVKSARKPQRPRIVVLPPKKPPIPDATEAVRPEGTEGQSEPSPPAPPQLPGRWPEAPPPGRFSR